MSAKEPKAAKKAKPEAKPKTAAVKKETAKKPVAKEKIKKVKEAKPIKEAMPTGSPRGEAAGRQVKLEKKPRAKAAKVQKEPKVKVKEPEIKVIEKPVIIEEKPKVVEKPKVAEKPKPAEKTLPTGRQAKVVEKPKAAEKPKQAKPEIKPEIKPEVKPPVVEEPAPVKEKILKPIELRLPITVKDLATKLSINPSDIIKRLMKQNVLATMNQLLDEDVAVLIAEEFGYKIQKLPTQEELAFKIHDEPDDPKTLKLRPPVVTFMGHVDHGKTSLLDKIRSTKVAEKESGGITQHIGAYEVQIGGKGFVTFLDTPGHEAFTEMRARGANATDIVVLVVAADEGIKPQTVEAIDHARAAGVPIVVAMNKIDKPNINIDMVKKQLMELELMPEDWGGKTITIGVSAKTGEGIDQLLEMLLLEAEMLELKANPNRLARGVVIEGHLSKGGGPIATILVQNGTLKVGDSIIIGQHYGNIRAMINDKGKRVQEAPPSTPVEILGLSGVPLAGEMFYAINDESVVKQVALKRQQEAKEKKLLSGKKLTLEDFYDQVKKGVMKELRLVIKSDVQGSLEAIKGSLAKITSQEVKIRIMHSAVGDINESDIILASASNAIIIGFHVEMAPEAQEREKLENVDVKLYKIIYELTNDIKAAMEGMLTPIEEEVFMGRAQIKQVFKVSKVGIIAGCSVLKGQIDRSSLARIIREGEKIHTGKVVSLKRFKEDAKQVREGFECGIGVSNFNDYKVGDLIETFEIKKTAKRLS